MKLLKTIVVFATLLIAGIVVVGCGNSNTSESEQTEQKEEASKDTVQHNIRLSSESKEANAVLDSLTRINFDIAKINLKIAEQDNSLQKNESSIVELRRTTLLSILVACGIGIVSLIISILAIVKTKAANERVRRHRQEIEELKHSSTASEARFENATRNMGISVYRLQSREYQDLSSRIYRIECQMKGQSQPVSIGSGEDNTISINENPSNELNGYFGLPIQMSATKAYFKRLNQSRDAEARFSVVVKNNKAEFSPLKGRQYFNDMKSTDEVRLAFDVQGCASSEAVQMIVINPGEAILENNRWIITKKVKIELSK